MSLDIQYKIKSNPNNLAYLREHSIWYKYLNRDSNSYNMFQDEVKTYYKLRTTDKISKALDTFDMLQVLISELK